MLLKRKFLLFFSLTGKLILGNELAISDWRIYPTYQYINQMERRGDTLYLATSGGLLLFLPEKESLVKGYTYKDGLSSHYLQSLAWEGENLWLGTSERGLLLFSSGGFLRYPPEKVPLRINKVFLRGDTILLGSPEGLYLIKTNSTPSDFLDDTVKSLIPGDIVYSLFADTFLWAGVGRGVYRIERDLARFRSYRTGVGDSVKGILKARDTIFFVAESGIAYYDPISDSIFPYFFFSSRFCVHDFKFEGGKFYIASNQGTFLYDGREFRNLWSAYTTAIFIHPGSSFGENYLLLGIRGADFMSGSLIKIRGEETKEIRFSTISASCVYSVGKDSDGWVYIPHLFWGANRISVITEDSIFFLSDPLPVPSVLLVDRRDRVWVGHWSEIGGLSCYDKTKDTWLIFQWGSQTPKNVIGALGIDQYETKWLWNGINILALDSLFNFYEFTIPGLGGCLRGYEFTFDSKGRVYLGTPNGLLRLDHNQTLSDFSDDEVKIFTEGLDSKNIFSLSSDSRDHIWVATPDGLGELIGERFRLWTKENSGLIANNCLRVVVDQTDWVWVLTDGGLSVFDPRANSWFTYTPTNSPLLPNWKNILEFYISLFVDEKSAGIGTREGLVWLSYEKILFGMPISLEVYPNPLLLAQTSQLRIRVQNLTLDSCALEIFTIRGKKVKINEVRREKGFLTVELDKRLGSGLYLISVKDEENPKRFALGKVVVLQ